MFGPPQKFRFPIIIIFPTLWGKNLPNPPEKKYSMADVSAVLL